MYVQIIILAVLIFLSAFFSGSETAMMSLSMLKIRHLVREKRRGSETLFKLKQHPHRLLVTILIGNNIVNIGASALATMVATEMFGSLGAGIAVGVITFLILVFGEITPKSLALKHAVKLSLIIAPIMRALLLAMYPLVLFFEGVAKIVAKIFGKTGDDKLTVAELKTIVTVGHEEGIIDKKLAKMMKNVLEFRDTKASEIMTPISGVRTVKAGSTIKKIIKFVNRSPYSRFPVLRGKKIIGILDVDDILKVVSTKGIGVVVDKLVRPARFVDGETSIDDLFVAFEKKNLHMVVVADNKGRIIGVVTLDDVLEEIVGEIFDKSEHKMRINVTGGELRLDAGTSIKALNKALNLKVRSKYFRTIAGLLEHKLGRKPKRGDVVYLGKKKAGRKQIKIKVTSVDRSGADRVKIVRL